MHSRNNKRGRRKMKKKSLYISFICLFGLFFININGQLSTQKKEKEKYRKNTKSSSLEKNDKRKRCGFFDPRYSKKHREFTKSSSYPEKVTIDTYERIIKYNKKHLEDPLQGYNLTPAIVSQTYRIKRGGEEKLSPFMRMK